MGALVRQSDPPVLIDDKAQKVIYKFDFAPLNFPVTIVSDGGVFSQDGFTLTKAQAIANLGLYSYSQKSLSQSTEATK